MFRKIVVAVALGTSALLLPGQEVSTPEVAPGIHLPERGSYSMLVEKSSKPSLVVLHGSELVSNTHAGSNFARSIVYAGPRRTVEIANLTSEVEVATKSPTFFARIPDDDPDTFRNRLSLIKLKPGKDTRICIEFSANVFGGSRKREVQEIAITKTDMDGGAWVKFTPEQPLEPGEYAVVELPKDKLLTPTVFYDFGVSNEAQ
ncbi:hypothetical protein [Silvibacterium sp.]|uniref:hypothetical protein n=1 Tax=Silvibacterium sp. TaxID=1964179 RepID=UPI0039E54B2F